MAYPEVNRISGNEFTSVEELQQKATAVIASLHKEVFEASSGTNPNPMHHIIQLDRCYKNMPEGYHLDMQITPDAYFRLRATAKNLLSMQARSREGLSYHLAVARYIQDHSHLDPGTTKLNIYPLGTDTDARIGITEVTREGVRQAGFSIRPQELLNMRIVPDSYQK
jgi:hypothetical protein